MRIFFKYLGIGFVFIFVWGIIHKGYAAPLLHHEFLSSIPFVSSVMPSDSNNTDTSSVGDLPYPFPKTDDATQPFPSENLSSPMYLNEPSNFHRDVEYDPVTNQYIFKERIGDNEIGMPHVMSFEDYLKYDLDHSMDKYWHMKARSSSFESHSALIPKLHIGGEAFNKIFGTDVIDIKPNGNAELIFGIKSNKTDNPSLPVKLRRNTTFDFQEKIQMNVVGQIGTKLKIGAKYDTEASFDFENEMKLGYQGDEDEIIQDIEAGNVSLPLTGTLIQGSQTLFGIKTKLKFGKLDITTIYSQQKGKTQTIDIQGGAQQQEFKIFANEYEANKHFFLAQYFHDHYDEALKNLPVIMSNINITRVEVWVTNKTGNYQDARNIVAFMDLGEKDKIYSSAVTPNYLFSAPYPSDSSNTIFDYKDTSSMNSAIRDINTASQFLSNEGFQIGVDYEKIESARKLSPSEYTINKKLGYISLNSALNSDEVLAVAFEYTVGGHRYQVGEFSTDGISAPKNLILKLIKGTSFSPKMPNWKLMMKNIYAIGAYQINSKNFKLDVFYQDDKTGTSVNYLSQGAVNGIPLITVLNLDNVNKQLDNSPDGVFDFIEGVTVNASNGKIIFPEVEPFGGYLKKKIIGDTPKDSVTALRYIYQELYDSTQSFAAQVAEKNKFFLAGTYQSASGSEISLNAINIPEGSVKVTAGAQTLTENVDYTVDYNLGRVKILNQGLLESGTPIKITLESNTLFSIQSKRLMGTHLDYHVSNDFNLGATILNLRERPLTQKVNIGEEPINNTIWGIDGTYRTESRFITKMVDMLPFLDTKAPSNITITGEFAQLIPGHPKVINKTGTSYIDDFEGSKTSIDLRSFHAWSLASTPQKQPRLFPEGDLINSLEYGFNRARLAWYTIDPLFVRDQSETPKYLKHSDAQDNHFVREVYETELFPNRESPSNFPTTIPILNLAFYPNERGPYNYDVKPTAVSKGMDENGNLRDPRSRWGGIMRSLETNDFEAANIEFIDFWLMDPFVYDSSATGGNLYFDLGDISEDVLKDSRKSFEQGFPTSDKVTNVDTTLWGRVPMIQSVVMGFDNNPQSRQYQDIGLDGLNDEAERLFYSKGGNPYGYDFIDSVAAYFGEDSKAYKLVEADPSADDYHYFRGDDYDAEELSILERYKKYNGMDGNSPTDEQSPESYPTQATVSPNQEDINRDNTLSEAENYFQYEINLRPDMQVGDNFITDVEEGENDLGEKVNWYHFRIPISNPNQVVGEIKDFKSIRFIRMFLKGFDRPTILRFATLELVRNEWRKYDGSLDEGGIYMPDEPTVSAFDVSAVNIEENSSKKPVNYVLPPGITRVIDPMQPQLRQLNEQALLLKSCELADGASQAVYKNVYMDMRKYKRLRMFVHAESVPNRPELKDGDVCVFVRLGTDYRDNYYEYEVPLEITPPGTYNKDDERDKELVWPENNEVNILFEDLQRVKQRRNAAMRKAGTTVSLSSPYRVIIDGKHTITVVGNPNISNVKTVMIGLRNRRKGTNSLPDDGLPKCVEVWTNELRLTDFDERGGWAANGRITTRLADFGSATLSGMISKHGFGSIEKKVSERSKEDVYQYDVSTNLQLGKFFPEKSGVRVPMFIGYSERFSNPQYDPLDPDIPLSVALSDTTLTKSNRDSILERSQTYLKRKSLNFTNVQVGAAKGKPHIYSLSNWAASYSYNEMEMHDINTKYNYRKNYRGSLAYNYNNSPKNYRPFSAIKFLRKKSFRFIRDFNFYLMPQSLSFVTDITRDYNEEMKRNLSEYNLLIKPTFDKNFYWNRNYSLRHKFTRSLTFDFAANVNSRIDEPEGRINKNDDDYEMKRDSIISNIKNFGRPTIYNHNFNLSYSLPINKLPYLNWLNVSTRYNARYEWKAAPLLDSINPGNTITNGNTVQISANANMMTFYNNFPVLKRIQRKYRRRKKQKPKKEKVYFPAQGKAPLIKNFKAGKTKTILHNLKTIDVDIVVTDTAGKKVDGVMKVLSPNRITFTASKDVKGAKVQITGTRLKTDDLFTIILEHTALLLMSAKSFQVSINDNNGTTLPGYLPKFQALGLQDENGVLAPGIGFVAGYQDPHFMETVLREKWLVQDSLLYQQSMMTHGRNYNVRGSLEPLKGLRVDLMLSHRFSENSHENIAYVNGGYEEQNRMVNGNFSMSTIAWGTAFKSVSANASGEYTSEVFDDFLGNRYTISKRLAYQRAHASGAVEEGYDPHKVDPQTGYPDGYGPYSQDVLIPAFLAAYTNTDPNNVSLKTFPSVFAARPNWRVSYDGLSKIDFVKHFIRTANLSHAYMGTFSINSYTRNLNYQPGEDGFSYVRDLLGNFYAENEIQAVSLSEQLNPLINVDLTWNNSLITRFEIKKTRNVSLNLASTQINEMRNTEWVVGTGYRIKDLTFTVKSGGFNKEFKSDLNLRLDLSVRDQVNLIHRMQERMTQVISGQQIITLKITADYVLSSRLNLRLFLDKIINNPKVSNTFPTSNTNFGVSIRFSLAQ